MIFHFIIEMINDKKFSKYKYGVENKVSQCDSHLEFQ